MKRSDVAIVGGGLIGAWAAFFLRRRGRSAVLVEKGVVGAHASGVNYGNLRLQGRHPAEFPLALRAHALWEQIETLIGERCELNRCGHLYIGFGFQDEERLVRYAREAHAAGLEVEPLGANEVQRRWPWLGGDVSTALWSHRDATANPRLVTPAVARAAVALGAELLEHARVTRIERAGDGFRVETTRGVAVESPFVINAAGAWGNEIAKMFGEEAKMFAAAPPHFVTEPVPYFIAPSVQAVDGSVIFRQIDRGNVIAGFYPRGRADIVTERAPVPPEKLLLGMERLARIVPDLAGSQVLRVWSGVEAYVADMLPVIGPSRTAEGLIHAYGFCGHGFQLSPGVGMSLAELVVDGQAAVPIAPFSIARFGPGFRADEERLAGEFDPGIRSQ